MQQNLIDAARAVIAADRAGELTDEMYESFTAAIDAYQHPDDVAVDRFALAMKAKLADARAKGRSGWDDPAQCSVEFLAQLLVGHIGKDNAGNFEDVANLAMMLHQRGADPSVLAEAATTKPAGEPVAWLMPVPFGLDFVVADPEWDGAFPVYRQQPAPAVPDGWDETLSDAADLLERLDCNETASELRAMIAAAPAQVDQQAPAAPSNGRGAMFVEFVSALAAKSGHKELAADLLAAIRAAGETGIQGLPAPAEPACHIAEVSDEEVAIACTPAQRLLLREGMQLYAAPVAGGAIQVRKLGLFGRLYDSPQERRAYTYADQPENVAAWRLGRAAANATAGGDHIDRGLSLLASLQAEGFGVFEMGAEAQEGADHD